MGDVVWVVLSCVVAFVGAVLALRLRAQMQWLTSFSAGLLMAVAVVTLLPEAFELQHSEVGGEGHRALLYIAGLGFLLFYTLDLLVPEQHAHGHEHHRHAPEVPRVIGLIGALMLSLHRALDGALISAVPMSAVGAAIVFHNFADGLSSASIMLRDGHSQRRTLLTSGIVAVCPLLGWLVGGWVNPSTATVAYALALFAGAFLYLGGSHLLIREHGTQKWAPLAAAGAFLLVYLLQH